MRALIAICLAVGIGFGSFAKAAEASTLENAYTALLSLPPEEDILNAREALQAVSRADVEKAMASLPVDQRMALKAELERLSRKAMNEKITVGEVLLSSQAGNKTASLGLIVGALAGVVFTYGVMEIFICNFELNHRCGRDTQCRVDVGRDCQRAMQFGHDLPGNSGRYRDGTLKN